MNYGPLFCTWFVLFLYTGFNAHSELNRGPYQGTMRSTLDCSRGALERREGYHQFLKDKRAMFGMDMRNLAVTGFWPRGKLLSRIQVTGFTSNGNSSSYACKPF